MDFTPELTTFQGVVISTNKIQPFARLIDRGGNEDKIQFVVDNLFSFLLNGNYINEDSFCIDAEDKMRKFALFLILNADLSVLDKMVDLEGLHSIIWILPTIPKCLLNEMLWKLHMDKFIYEIISFCTPEIGLEVAQLLCDNMKYATPSTCLDKLKITCSACYRLLCRLHLYNLDNESISNFMTVLFNIFHRCVNYFTAPPNAHKLVSISKDEQYRFKGTCLYTMFSLINECLDQYPAKQGFTSNDFNEVYLLTFMIDVLAADTNKVCTRTSDILELLDKCHLVLLDACKTLVMDVSVDIFCTWTEFEENGISMQQKIGELCFKLREKLLHINSLCEHPVVSMMEQISWKPVSYQEIINTTDIQTIVENIAENSNKDEWIRALIHRDKLCNDAALIEQLSGNVDLLQADECHTLFNICQDYSKNSCDNSASITLLSTKLFIKCTNDIKCEILEDRFKDNLFDMNETEEFGILLTEIFNKLIASQEIDLYDILNVFIQSPQKVFTKIFLLAAENSQQTDIMLRVMTLLEKYLNLRYSHETEPCVIGTINNILNEHLDTDSKKDNFVKFLCALKNSNIITGSQLLLLIVMPQLHKALLGKNISAIYVQCRILCEAYGGGELTQYRTPMLAMLAQVMETVRWRFDTYSPFSPNTLHLVLQLHQSLCGTYTSGIPENEKTWLSKKLNTLQPLNLYYFNKLWRPSNESFLEEVLGMSVTQNTDRNELAAGLSMILCSCTQTEWGEIWKDMHVFGGDVTIHILSNVLVQVSRAEAANRSDTTFACLMNCYRNFVYIIRYIYFKEPLSDHQISTVINKIAPLADLHQDNVEDIATVLLPLIGYMVEKKDDYSMDVPREFEKTLKNTKISEAICKTFTNGST